MDGQNRVSSRADARDRPMRRLCRDLRAHTNVRQRSAGLWTSHYAIPHSVRDDNHSGIRNRLILPVLPVLPVLPALTPYRLSSFSHRRPGPHARKELVLNVESTRTRPVRPDPLSSTRESDPPPAIAWQSINSIRALAMDAVEQAQSGHPGTPMALAPAAYVLWTRFLRHNPRNP